MILPEHIRDFRTFLGLSLAGFAARLEVTEGCVRRWEKGETTPRYKQAMQLDEMVRGSKWKPGMKRR